MSEENKAAPKPVEAEKESPPLEGVYIPTEKEIIAQADAMEKHSYANYHKEIESRGGLTQKQQARAFARLHRVLRRLIATEMPAGQVPGIRTPYGPIEQEHGVKLIWLLISTAKNVLNCVPVTKVDEEDLPKDPVMEKGI